MDSENREMFQAILSGMEGLEERLNAKIARLDTKIEESETRLNAKIKESEARINIKIENEVCKRIDSLFDGYKLTHEKQWELERETQALKEQVEELQTRLSLIEKKISA